MKLRTKLLLYILVPIICALSIIIYGNYMQTKEDTISSAKTNMRTSANFVTDNIAALFQNVRSSIHILSDRPSVKSVLRADEIPNEEIKTLQEYFLKVRELLPLTEDVFLLDSDGSVVVSTNPKDYGNNYSDREYFINAKQGEFVVSHTLISRATNQHTIFMSIPIFIDNTIAGVLVTCIIVEKIIDSCFQKVYLSPTKQFILIDENNNIIARINDSTSQYRIQGLRDFDIFSNKTEDTFVFTNNTGMSYTGYYQKILFNDWIAIVLVSDRELLARVYTATLHNGTLLLISILGVVIIIIFIVSNLTTSLTKALAFAQAVTAGNFDAHLKERRTDELGQLYDALRAMMHTIQQTKDALHSVLEEKNQQLTAAQESLIKENALNKIILNSIPDFIFCKSKESVYTGCNTALAAFLGKESHEIIGKTDQEVFSFAPELAQRFIDADQEVFLNPQKPFVLEESITHSDGTVLTVETIKTVYSGDDGTVFGLLGVSRDISLRKATEKALRIASEKALEASQAKSDFLARMSHEIRTPLNAIIGMAYLLRQISLEQKQLDYLHKIDISAKNLLAVLNDILDYSKIEARKLAIENAPFCLDTLMSEVVAVFEGKAVESGLQLSVSMDDAVHKKVLGDRLRLTQVLLNIVSNALKFTHEGSISIAVHLKSDTIDAQTCVFSVADTGIGMNAEQCSRLFSAFTQADGYITRKYGGTGLGLAINKMLVELMGGEIWAQSAPNVGTQFFFRLRLLKDISASAHDSVMPLHESASSPPPEQVFLNKTILLVEDNVINQEIALEVLKMFGLRVDLAENGQQALDMCATLDYDLVLMDIQMPVMDGYTATRLLRQDARYANVPIIAMTANALTTDRAECLNAGMNDHQPKPFDPMQLRHTLQKWLNAPTVCAGVQK